MIYDWLTARGVRFLPVVQWVERGLKLALNSVRHGLAHRDIRLYSLGLPRGKFRISGRPSQ
jgi:hypothetical protein